MFPRARTLQEDNLPKAPAVNSAELEPKFRFAAQKKVMGRTSTIPTHQE